MKIAGLRADKELQEMLSAGGLLLLYSPSFVISSDHCYSVL